MIRRNSTTTRVIMAIVETRMNFLPPWSDSKENPYVRGAPSEGFEKSNFEQQEYPVTITDARDNMENFSLDKHAFAFYQDSDLSDEILEALRSNDANRISREYFPLVERLVRQKTGAGKVVIFDHAVRRREPDSTAKYDGEVKAKKAMQPAGLVRRSTRRALHESPIHPLSVSPSRSNIKQQQVHCDQ